MAIEADRNKVFEVIVPRISINMVNLDICRACFATEATMACAPQENLCPILIRYRNAFLLHVHDAAVLSFEKIEQLLEMDIFFVVVARWDWADLARFLVLFQMEDFSTIAISSCVSS